MSSDPAEIQKSVRSYIRVFVMLMIFTVITVAASRFHLAIPVGITVALVIAVMKGSMVAAVFMHLSHEKRWVYGTLLLTAAFFVVLLLIPLFTSLDGLGIGSPWTSAKPGIAKPAIEKSGG
jgi:cytochrome c oxidase subunit 4